MKKKITFLGLILVLLTLALSGCLDFFTEGDDSTTYVSHPTAVRYTISYGYTVECSGSGEYTLKYSCDLPELLDGVIYPVTALNNEYTEKTLATFNTVYSWEIKSTISTEYTLGITATVEAESYLVSDLNGADALTIQEINIQYSNFVDQYTQPQSNDTTTFIDPDDSNIQTIAYGVLNGAGTNNAFLVAKELFKWLKQQTTYQIHTVNNEVQPASFTLQCKTGDCDDLSFLYISLCRAVGIPARFIRGFLIEDDAIPHAWAEVFVGGGIGKNGWIPIECAGTSGDAEVEINQNFALESADHLRIFKDDGSNESINISLSGFYSLYGVNRVVEPESFTNITNYYVVRSNELEIDENGYRSYK